MRISVAGIGSYDPDKPYDFDEVEAEIESIVQGEATYGADPATPGAQFVRPGLRLVGDAWGSDRRTIDVGAISADVTRQAIDAIAEHPDVYARDATLVRVVATSTGPAIEPARARWVRDVMSECIDFMRRAKAAAVPADLPQTVVEHRVYPGVRELHGVVEAPTLRPDGTLIDRAGYDETTGLLYVPRGEYPSIPAAPSLAEAQDAAARLMAPLAQFPWRGDSDRSAALGVVLALVGRHAIDGAVPLTAIRAHTPGTGKTLLAKCLTLIGTGRMPTVRGASRDDSEAEREILGLVRAAKPSVLLDNLSGAFGSEAWARALTADDEISGRLIGSSTEISGVWRSVVTATGNNLTFRGDLGRRVLPADLESDEEHPEQRNFDEADLRGYLRGKQPELRAAALTILRAYVVAGRPGHGLSAMGSFEAWDRFVRGALIWIGMADPCGGRDRIQDDGDEERLTIGALLEAAEETFQAREWATRDTENRTDDLTEAIQALVPPRADRAMVGRALRGIVGRTVGGRKLVQGGTKTRPRWRVVKVGGAS